MGPAKVVLLHGFLGGSWSYDAVLAGCHRSYDVLVPTLSFHGESRTERARRLRFSDEVRRIAARIERFSDPSKVILVGYSMGGRIALGIAVHFPQLVERLVLVSSRRGLDTWGERAARIQADERWAQRLEHDGLGPFLERWAEQPIFRCARDLPLDVLERERVRRSAHDARELACALRQLGLGRQPGYALGVRRLEIPVNLLVGEFDQKFVALSARLASELPKAQRSVVKGASHQLLLEAPTRVSRIIDEGQES